MPFGLRNAAQTFQRFNHEALSGLEFVYAYIDDLLIASNSVQQHKQHLRSVFQRLSQFGLCINADKCVLGATAVDFFGVSGLSSGLSTSSGPGTSTSRFSET
ncbi:uncharacterized protein K02A2.6-like [Rhagoletis pomonella]|uniref:uncharacterized protein K02A2.6-like n=1 Tax=Rhagoletis pomonella TaxID=28610 RepID=UPI001785799B|nr:uncharacterized protein K02A2.6-like [Rhagoletis pomonella]